LAGSTRATDNDNLKEQPADPTAPRPSPNSSKDRDRLFKMPRSMRSRSWNEDDERKGKVGVEKRQATKTTDQHVEILVQLFALRKKRKINRIRIGNPRCRAHQKILIGVCRTLCCGIVIGDVTSVSSEGVSRL
jgi:hypothetical protein